MGATAEQVWKANRYRASRLDTGSNTAEQGKRATATTLATERADLGRYETLKQVILDY